MSIHIAATKGEISNKILLPGDPLRAKWIAEHFLQDAKCYNTVRNMLGYTGYYKNQCISVQGTGMGIPSASIYIEELIHHYDVKSLIRVGSAGSLQKNVNLKEVVIAMSASTNSSLNNNRFFGANYAPTADFNLFIKSIQVAEKKNIKVHAGNVLTSDTFYVDNKAYYDIWKAYKVLCVEMELAALYTIAAKYNAKALGVLTISDSLVTDEETTSLERQQSFDKMIHLALDTILD